MEVEHYRVNEEDLNRSITTKAAEIVSVKRSNDLIRDEVVDLQKQVRLLKTDTKNITDGR